MATKTFNPVVHKSLRYYNATFSGARNGTSAIEVSSTGSVSLSVRTEFNSGVTEYDIDRNFMIFETASIGGTITSATLRINVKTAANPASTPDNGLALVVANPDSNSAILAEDFNNITSTELSDARVSGSSTGFKTFTFNATGLANISTSKNTVLAIRNNKDIDNETPTETNNGDPRISTITDGESLQPLLTVTYTPSINQAFII